MHRPGDVVHEELYEAPPTGALYAVRAVSKRSGGYMAECERAHGRPRLWFCGSGLGRGYRTVRGAVEAAKRLAREAEDVTYDEDFDRD